MLSGFWRGNLKKNTIVNIRLKWTYNIKMHLEELGINFVIWIMCLRIGTSGGL